MKGWKTVIICCGLIGSLLVLLFWQTAQVTKLQRENSILRLRLYPEFVALQVDLTFNNQVPDREVWVSEDLKQYVGWIFIHQEIGACHITGTFQGFINCIEIRSDPWRKLPRRIVATLVSQNCLKRYFGLEWGEEKNESIAD